ncbi:MAG: formylglycine-generating enzyme family protein [Polyangiales bacterium]
MSNRRTLRLSGRAGATLIAAVVGLSAPFAEAAGSRVAAFASLNPVAKTSSAKAKTSSPTCPNGMSAIPTTGGGYCIDKFEGSLVEVLPKGKTKAFSATSTVTGRVVRAVSKKGVAPQGYISQVEAAGACEHAGKRLCTNDEWMQACRGKSPTTYPYGDDEVKGRCNGDGTRQHPIVELFGASPDPFADASKMNDPRINALPDTVSKTGSKAKCRSSYDVYDMVGNVHEWTSNPSGEFKGGFYMDTHRNGDGCFYKTTAHSPSYHDYSTGFRCCK